MTVTKGKWNPAKHPRDPIGRFAEIGGGSSESRSWSPNPERHSRQRGVYASGRGGARPEQSLQDEYHSGALLAGGGRPLSNDQRMALADYADGSGINDQLRRHKRISKTEQWSNQWGVSRTYGLRGENAPTQAEYVRHIDSAIEQNSLAEDTAVYRAMSSTQTNYSTDTQEPTVWGGLQPGDQIVDRGFMSTTTDPSQAADFGDMRMEIELPAGTHVGPVSSASENEGAREQAELLVGRGAVLEILERGDPDESGITRLRARLVGYV